MENNTPYVSITNNGRNAKRVRFHIRVLALVFVLLPIGSALTGIIGSTSPITLLLLFYVVFAFFGSYRINRKISRSTIVVMMYFLYSCLSILWGWNKVYQSWYITNILLNTLVFFIAATDRYEDAEIQTIQNSFVWGAVLALIVALICRIRSNENRLIITIFSTIDPNEFGFNLCFYSAIILSFITKGRKKTRSVIGLILLASGIIMTGSRGSMLTLIIMLFVWFIVYGGIHRFKILLIGAVIISGVLAILGEFFGDYMLGRLNVFSSVLSDGGSGRFAIWNAAVQKFSQSDFMHKLFGYGFGTFPRVVNYIAPGHTEPYASHNIFVDCLITGGIVGCVLLAAAFIAIVAYSFKHKNIGGVLSVIALFSASLALDLQFYKAFALVFVVGTVLSQRTKAETGRYGNAVKYNRAGIQRRKISA